MAIERATGVSNLTAVRSADFGKILSRAGIAISAAIVIFAAFKVDWRETGLAFTQADPFTVALGALLFFVSLVFFAMRWRSLCIGGERIPRPNIFAYQMIGYMANAVLPLRPGDLIRVLLIRQRHGVRGVHGLASIVFERLLDLITILSVGFILSLFVDFPRPIRIGIIVFSIAIGVALAGLIALSIARHLVFLHYIISLIPENFRMRLAQLRAALHHILDIHHSVPVIVTNCAGWSCLFAGATVLLFGLHVPAPWFSAPLVLVVTNLGSAIPASPGGIGVYHALVVLTLAIWGVAAPIALAYAILVHALAIGLHVLLGSSSILITGTASIIRDSRELKISKLMETGGVGPE